jgi:hypothetical protein
LGNGHLNGGNANSSQNNAKKGRIIEIAMSEFAFKAACKKKETAVGDVTVTETKV